MPTPKSKKNNEKTLEITKFPNKTSENTKDPWSDFLAPAKVIRDAVHGDIWITDMEMEIIGKTPFQRLRYIRQLGTTHLIYPSANHTRFEHSLGVLHIAQKIIESVNRNFKYKNRIVGKEVHEKLVEKGWKLYELNDRDKVLIRLTALLHDAAHIPFGHTLEKEGNLFKRTQWADNERVEIFFDGCYSGVIRNFLTNGGVKDQREVSKFIEDLRNTLRAIEGVIPNSDKLAKNEDEAISKLDLPYVADIVGNTVCADLLDYLLRDSHFTGYRLAYDPRIIENFIIMGKFNGTERRLVLLLLKKGKLRPDVITSVFNLLELRYQLAETVYYHRVNKVVSALIINSIGAALKANIISFDDLLQLTDETLIYKMHLKLEEGKGTDDIKKCLLNSAKNTLKKYEERKIYKPVYMVYSRESGFDTVKINDLIEMYTRPSERLRFQNWIENLLGLEEGSVIMYVTKEDKGKDALTKVLWIDCKIKSLKKVGEEGEEIVKDFTSALEKRYKKLWRLYVFVDKDKLDDYGVLISGYCKHKLFERNDIENKKLSEAMPIDDADIYVKMYHNESEILKEQMRTQIAARQKGTQRPLKPKQMFDDMWNDLNKRGG